MADQAENQKLESKCPVKDNFAAQKNHTLAALR